MKSIGFSVLFLLSSYSSFSEVEQNPKAKLQLEDLLIWKISDELKLNPDQEKKISEIIKTINKKKTENTVQIDALTQEIIKNKNDIDKNKAFQELKKRLQTHSAISAEELDKIKSLLGIKKLGQYLELKNDISEKVKSIILPSDKKGGKKLPPPKVIEE